jgi:ankyrin repeat protein
MLLNKYISRTAVLFNILFLISYPLQAQDIRLPEAAMNRDSLRVIALLQEGVNPDTRGQFDTPALHWLVRINDIETTRVLRW